MIKAISRSFRECRRDKAGTQLGGPRKMLPTEKEAGDLSIRNLALGSRSPGEEGPSLELSPGSCCLSVQRGGELEREQRLVKSTPTCWGRHPCLLPGQPGGHSTLPHVCTALHINSRLGFEPHCCQWPQRTRETEAQACSLRNAGASFSPNLKRPRSGFSSQCHSLLTT